MKKMFLGIIIILFSLSLNAEILDSLTTSCIDSALTTLGLEAYELGFKKTWVKDDTFKLKIVDSLLHNPLQLPLYTESVEQTILTSQDDPLALLKFSAAQLDLRISEITPDKFDADNVFENWIKTCNRADKFRRKFYSELDSLELHDLIMAVPTLWSAAAEKNEGALQLEFGALIDTTRNVSQDDILNIIKKLDRQSLYQGGLIFFRSMLDIYQNIAIDEFSKSPTPKNIAGVQGEILDYRETDFGKLVIGGVGDNIYYDDFALIIDIGGDDIYRNRAGGAVGKLNSGFSAVIDLAGDDLYQNEEKIISQGAGFLGYGMLLDRSGNDVYRGSDYAQGVGIFGLGLFFDEDGIDDHRAGSFSQGAGNVGSGLLIDQGIDDDHYHASLYAQGVGSVFGFGALIELGGDDSYRCGGAVLHDPLLPEDFQSFSHGFGMGWRPRAGGGIGILYDKKGNDFYDGEVYCQGASYWYSLGILIDAEGNDSYSAVQYAQGAGIHLSVGSLWDKAGDDQYHSRNGVVGGTAHDLSVASFIEEKGDDHYSVSGGYGISLTNSVGIFIDKLGNDMYSTWEKFSFGGQRKARGFNGCGIFLDLEGKDHYSSNTFAANAKLWFNQDYAVGIDLDRDIIASEKEEEIGEIILTKEDSLRSVEELYDEAALWGVGSNRKKVSRARKAFLTKGTDAVKYVCENKLMTDSSLQMRLIRALAKEYPDSMAFYLQKKIFKEDLQTRKNVISLLGITKAQKSASILVEVLFRNDYYELQNRIISALGNIGEPSAALQIAPFIDHEDEIVRLSAVNALKKLADERTIPFLIFALQDDFFTVRTTTSQAFGNFPPHLVYSYLVEEINSGNLFSKKSVIQALGELAFALKDSTSDHDQKIKKKTLKDMEKFYTKSQENIKATIIEIAWKMEDQDLKKFILKKDDLSILLKAVWEKCENKY